MPKPIYLKVAPAECLDIGEPGSNQVVINIKNKTTQDVKNTNENLEKVSGILANSSRTCRFWKLGVVLVYF